MTSMVRLSRGSERPARLICFPYAGGSAAAYRSLAEELPAHDVWSVEYPGRGTRRRESLVADVHGLAAEAAGAVPALLDRPALLFGYSMGAAVAFEVAQLLGRQSLARLAALVVAAAAAPHRHEGERTADMDDATFLEHVLRFGGTPEDVRCNAELLELALPILRADFTAGERYRCRATAPLALPILAFSGTRDDSVASSDVEAWALLTTRGFEHQRVEGDHFFLHEGSTKEPGTFPSLLERTLAKALEGAAP